MTADIITPGNVIARKLEHLDRMAALRAVDVARLLGTRAETISRWNQGKAFPRREAQKRLIDLEYIVDLLSGFYEPQETRLWLFSRQKLLGGRTPAELIHQGRTDEVIAVIEQLRDGVYL